MLANVTAPNRRPTSVVAEGAVGDVDELTTAKQWRNASSLAFDVLPLEMSHVFRADEMKKPSFCAVERLRTCSPSAGK